MGQADLLEQTGRIERVGVEAGELRQHVAGALVAGKPGALQHHPDALGEGLVIGHRVQPVDPHLARRRPAVSSQHSIVDVLPAPLGPRTAVTAPKPAVSDRPLTAMILP